MLVLEIDVRFLGNIIRYFANLTVFGIDTMSQDYKDFLADYMPQGKYEYLLDKIAKTLEVHHDELRDATEVSISSSSTDNPASLAAECTALIKAYTSIRNPQDRLKCLNIIRRTAENI